MIPYSYSMVDMGGIDLAEANGTVVEGLYSRLALARNACGDLILYNWKFAEIEITPGICSTLDEGTSIVINGLIQVTEEDEVTVLGIEPPPPPIEPVEPLVVTQNGVYEAEPPVSGFNPVTVNVQGPVPDNDILFHFNGDFRNSGSCPAVFSSVVGLTISDEQSKFGGYSLKCGTTQTLGNVVLESGFTFADDDFTIDFWVFPTSLSSSTSKTPLAFTYRSLGVYLYSDKINLALAKTNGSWYYDQAVNVAISISAWHHIAAVRSGETIYLFFDGIKVIEVAFGAEALAPTTAMTVGSNSYSNGDRRFQGYIDELRIKIGQAVWTSDFTPPTEPYA